MKPRTNLDAGFHSTAWIDFTGMRFSPLPAVARAKIPDREIVTIPPSSST